ncbi:MAG: hypothetical protein GY760_05050 [Deltaproteobacteria bacterium]|nr:hypothetical protein [Deltaproteobacteria bacterium]
MNRILVTGNAGSGKTYLSQKIHSILDIPLYSMDSIVWKPYWKTASSSEIKNEIDKIISKKKWIVDGVSSTIQKSADCVIFIDCTRRKSFFRVFKRNLPYLFRSRPGLPENCLEIKIIPRLINIIWNFPKDVKPGILKKMNQESGQLNYHFKTREEVNTFLKQGY